MARKTSVKRKSVRALAEELGTSSSRIQSLRKQGYSDKEIMETVDAGTESGNGHTAEEDDDSLLELKKKKLQKEIEGRELAGKLTEIKIRKEEKELISFEASKDTIIKIGSITKSSVLALESVLPSMLEGLSSEEMIPLLRAELDKVVKNIKKESEAALTVLLKDEK